MVLVSIIVPGTTRAVTWGHVWSLCSPRLICSSGDRPGRRFQIRRANAGPGAARNVGLSRAAGDYLMVVDADDLLPPEAVTRHL